jgi:hypothetical protein
MVRGMGEMQMLIQMRMLNLNVAKDGLEKALVFYVSNVVSNAI